MFILLSVNFNSVSKKIEDHKKVLTSEKSILFTANFSNSSKILDWSDPVMSQVPRAHGASEPT